MVNLSLERLNILLKVTQLSLDMGLLILKTPAPNNYILLVFVSQPRSLYHCFSETYAILALLGHFLLIVL